MTAFDAIRHQVMWSRLLSVVEEQAQTLVRTAFSTPAREAGDISAGVFDLSGRMLAQAVTGTPGHVNSMALSVGHFVEKFPPATMREGDVFITNDPWKGTGHLNDFTVVSPTFRNGRIVALFASTSHVVDIGGLGQGPDARQVYQEGLFVPLMPFAANLIEQKSRGRVSITSTDPQELPTIDAGLLQHPDDIKAVRTAMEFIAGFVDDDLMRPYYGRLLLPTEDEDWGEYAQSTYDSHHHGSGTCMMGPASDPMAVVDNRLKMHGMDNLYVADASIMPTVTHANTNVTSIMIGERLSDFVREAGR